MFLPCPAQPLTRVGRRRLQRMPAAADCWGAPPHLTTHPWTSARAHAHLRLTEYFLGAAIEMTHHALEGCGTASCLQMPPRGRPGGRSRIHSVQTLAQRDRLRIRAAGEGVHLLAKSRKGPRWARGQGGGSQGVDSMADVSSVTTCFFGFPTLWRSCWSWNSTAQGNLGARSQGSRS